MPAHLLPSSNRELSKIKAEPECYLGLAAGLPHTSRCPRLCALSAIFPAMAALYLLNLLCFGELSSVAEVF